MFISDATHNKSQGIYVPLVHHYLMEQLLDISHNVIDLAVEVFIRFVDFHVYGMSIFKTLIYNLHIFCFKVYLSNFVQQNHSGYC